MISIFQKKEISDIQKKDFLKFVERISDPKAGTEEEDSKYIDYFNKIVLHPAKSDLIFWPSEGIETPEDVVNEIEGYCRENHLPCFKDS